MAISFSIISCGNIQGNQADDKPAIKNDGNESSTEIAPEYLTYDTFKEKVWDFEKNPEEWKYEGDVPCVIDFYADWCKPCKMVAPVLEELSEELAGKINIYKVNTEDEQLLAAVFGIQSIPSILFVPKDGQPQMAAGALPKETLLKAIEDVCKIK